MPDRVQDLKNHRQVAVACKNYTDKEIKASEERILSIVARNNVDFIDHINEPTYRFTAPANAKLLMLQSIAGNSVKYSPSVASDNNATHIKTLPSTVYDMDVSKVEGVGYKVNQLVVNGNFETVNGWNTTRGTLSVNNNVATPTCNEDGALLIDRSDYLFINNHKYLVIAQMKATSGKTLFIRNFTTNSGITTLTANGSWQSISVIDYTSSAIANYPKFGLQNAVVGDSVDIKNVNIFDLTADFGSGNEPTSVSDCASAYIQRGINIYEYTPQQSSIKNNAFIGVNVEGTNHYDINTIYSDTTKFTITGSKVTSSSAMFFYNTRRYFKQDEIGKTFTFKVLFTSNCSGIGFRVGGRINNADVNGTFISTFPNYSSITITPTSTNDFLRIDFSDGSNVEIDKVMLNEGSSAIDYIPYTSQTIPIDLTTIKDSNNVSLFPSGKMMGNSNVADFVTPYNQESRWNELDLSTPNWQYWGANNCWLYEITSIIKYDSTNYLCDKYQLVNSYNDMPNNSYFIRYYNNQAYIYIKTDGTQVTRPSGILQYERATPLTSNTDLTTLTRINAQSNGTITLNNTDNVDMPNLISYNAIIKHALATAVKYESFNVWDEEWEDGSINTTTGQNESQSDRIRSKNYIEVNPNVTYYFRDNSGGAPILQYDSNQNYIGYAVYHNHIFTLNANCKYIRFYCASTTYNNDICINISGTLNGTYKPHKASITRLLPNSEAKYSWGITDGVRNTRVFCDDEGNAVNEGSLVVGNVDLGEVNYTQFSTNSHTFFSDVIDNVKLPSYSNIPNIICKKYEAKSIAVLTQDDTNGIGIHNSQSKIVVTDLNYDSTTSDGRAIFKSAMNGIPLFYEKNTTDTETLDDFDYFFDCEEGDTFTIIGCELLQCYATYSFLIKEAKSNE